VPAHHSVRNAFDEAHKAEALRLQSAYCPRSNRSLTDRQSHFGRLDGALDAAALNIALALLLACRLCIVFGSAGSWNKTGFEPSLVISDIQAR
jgi:hypothetical protein